MPKVLEQTNTRIGQLLVDTMNEQGLEIKDLAEKLDITYEHARRLVRGEGLPSRFVLKMICDGMGLNYKLAEKLATANKIEKKYGSVPMEIAGKKPTLEPIERVWDTLTLQQQEDATSMILGWAKRNKAQKSL